MAEPISEKTGIQLGFVITVGALVFGSALAFFDLRSQVLMLAPVAERFPAMELKLSHIKRDVAEIRSEESATKAWKRTHMQIWCAEAERMNNGFRCPDPYKDVP